MDHLKVWVSDMMVGTLSRNERGVSFTYEDGVPETHAVSLELPVRAEPYEERFGMLPAFDTNIPEGALLQKIRGALAKTNSGRVDAIDVLRLTGGNQIGRIRILPPGDTPERRTPVSDLGDLLHQDVNARLIAEVTDRYALRSGVSGAMPKVLAELTDAEAASSGNRTTIQTRNYILKFDDADYPGLSLNEFHCLRAAELAGNKVPDVQLSDDGRMLAVTRFDERDGERIAFEDLCSLNGKTAEQKYEGSVESSLFKKVAQHSGENAEDNLKALFRMIVSNTGLRNGDAHLKNFAMLYSGTESSDPVLAPAYDIVTTRAYLREDLQSLSLSGSTRWPTKEKLVALGARAGLDPAQAEVVIAEVAEGIQAAIPEMVRDLTERGHEALAEIMTQEWIEGLSLSLGVTPPIESPFADAACETSRPGR